MVGHPTCSCQMTEPLDWARMPSTPQSSITPPGPWETLPFLPGQDVSAWPYLSTLHHFLQFLLSYLDGCQQHQQASIQVGASLPFPSICTPWTWLSWSRGQQTFSVKGHRINIFQLCEPYSFCLVFNSTIVVRKVLVAELCQTLCNLMNCSPPGSSIHGILQARILRWITFPFSRGSSHLRDQNLRLPPLQADSLPSEQPGKPSGQKAPIEDVKMNERCCVPAELHLQRRVVEWTPSPEHPPFGLLCPHPRERIVWSPAVHTKWWTYSQTLPFSLLTLFSPLHPHPRVSAYGDCGGAGLEGVSAKGAELMGARSVSPTCVSGAGSSSENAGQLRLLCLSFTFEPLSLEYDESSTQSPMKFSMYLHILFCGSVSLRMKKIREWKNTVVVHQG